TLCRQATFASDEAGHSGSDSPDGRPNMTADMGVWIGYGLAVLVLIGMIYGTWDPQNRSAMQFNVWVLISGGLIGWGVGMLMTPVTDPELHNFPEYAKVISTFITGYLVAKVDKVFDVSQVDKLFVQRLLMFLSMFVLGVLATYVWRSYV